MTKTVKIELFSKAKIKKLKKGITRIKKIHALLENSCLIDADSPSWAYYCQNTPFI